MDWLCQRQKADPGLLSASFLWPSAKQLTSTMICLQKKQAPAENRAVRLDAGQATEGFCGNDIKTAKYNLVTFLPIFLCEVFSRAAYLYFLLQVIDMCI